MPERNGGDVMPQSWDQADFVALPLLDGGQALAQVVDRRGALPGTAFLALTSRRVDPAAAIAPLTLSEILAIRFVEAAHLDDGTWPILGFDRLPATERLVRLADARSDALTDPPGTVAAAVAEAFVNACHGLLAWDFFPQADLFDRMLAPGLARPAAARIGGAA